MGNKHAIQYPPMSLSNIRLRMAVDSSEINKLDEEFVNDMECRANLSISHYQFLPIDQNTWNEENWLIYYKDELVGRIIIYRKREHNTASLSLAVIKKYRDSFIGVKAVCLILRYAFDVLGIRKIETSAYGFNLRSIKMYGYLMDREGVRKESFDWAGRYWDDHLFGLTKYQWQERRWKVDRILSKRKDND